VVEKAEKNSATQRQDDEASLSLKVEVQDAGPCRKALKIEVPAEAVKAEYEKSLRELSRNAEVPGFRKGHVPRPRLLKMFSKELMQGLKAKLVARAAQEAIATKALEPVSEPVFGPGREPKAAGSEEDDELADKYLRELELKPEAPFSFEMSVEVKPTFELPPYKGIKLTSRRAPVTEEQVDRFIDDMRRLRADYLAVEEGGARVGDRITLGGWKLEVEGRTVAESSRGIVYLHDKGVEGLPVGVPHEKIEGVSAGAELQLDVVVPDDFEDESLRGKPARLTLKVEEVKRPRLPPLDDACAKELGAPDLATLRQRVRERLEVQAIIDERKAQEDEIIARLSEGANFELPQGLLEQEARSRELRQFVRLAEVGLDADKFPREFVDALRQRARESSPQSLRARFILERIADVEKLDVTEGEVEEQIHRYAAASGKTPVAVRSRLEKNGQLDELRREIRLRKVLNFLIEHADKGNAPAAEPPPGGGASPPGQGGSV